MKNIRALAPEHGGPQGSALADASFLALGSAVAIGFARFAYALLLPPMRADLGWTFAQAGAMNTANAAGYLLGALLAAPIAARVGGRQAFRGAVAATAAALLSSALTASFPALLLLRLLSGVAGAVAFIVGGALVAHLAERAIGRAALLLSVYFAGGGLGIFLSALALTPLLGAPGRWRLGWAALGTLSVVALLAVLPTLGRVDDLPPPRRSGARSLAIWPLRWTFAAYLLFGLGYISYVTFVIALLRGEGFGVRLTGAFWALLGLAAMAAPALWGPALQRLRGGRGLALVMLALAAGAALPVVSHSALVAILSAAIFGGSFLNVVTAVTAIARRRLPPAAWTAGIGALTVVFAAGQGIGPLLSGVLADRTGGVALGLAISAGLLFLGAVVALAQRE